MIVSWRVVARSGARRRSLQHRPVAAVCVARASPLGAAARRRRARRRRRRGACCSVGDRPRSRRRDARGQRQRGRGAGRLAHDEAGARRRARPNGRRASSTRSGRRRAGCARRRRGAPGSSIRYGSWLKPRDPMGGQPHSTSPATCISSGQPLTPIVSSKSAQPSTSSPRQRRVRRPGAASRGCRAAARCRARRPPRSPARARAGSAGSRRPGAGLRPRRRESERASVPSRREPSAFLQLGHVDAPLVGVLLRPDDRAAAREAERRPRPRPRPSARGIVRQASPARCGIDVADAEHQRSDTAGRRRRRPSRMGTPAQCARSPSPEQSMKTRPRDRDPAGLGLDQERVDASVARAITTPTAKRVEQQLRRRRPTSSASAAHLKAAMSYACAWICRRSGAARSGRRARACGRAGRRRRRARPAGSRRARWRAGRRSW